MMLKEVLVTGMVFIWLLVSGLLWTRQIDIYMFTEVTLMGVFAGLGISAGLIKALIGRKNMASPVSKKRHTLGSFLEHWGTAAGIFIMIISGFGVRINGTLFSSNLHFTGLLITLLFGCYFAADFVISRKYRDLLPDGIDIIDGTMKKYLLHSKWPESGKYQSSQKSAFLAFMVLGSEILITGAIKTAALSFPLSSDVLRTATLVHDAAGVLFTLLLVVHIGLVLMVRQHTRLLRSWFTGGNPIETHKQAETITIAETDLEEVQ